MIKECVEVSGRRVALAAGIGVVLAAVNTAVINELHAGWPWWVAAGVLTLAGAGLAGWLAVGSAGEQRRIGSGAVVAGRDIGGRIRTDGSRPTGSAGVLRSGSGVDQGAVVAGRDITGEADIDTTGSGWRNPRQPRQGA
jgi:hypothetical protein